MLIAHSHTIGKFEFHANAQLANEFDLCALGENFTRNGHDDIQTVAENHLTRCEKSYFFNII